MKELKVKQWVIDKAQQTAGRYNTYIDFTRRDEARDGRPMVEDGCVFVMAEEILGETEKAVQVLLSSGSVLGSTKGWKLWVPKSQMMEI